MSLHPPVSLLNDTFKEYFESLSDALEVRVRTASVNDKITYATEVRLRPCVSTPTNRLGRPSLSFDSYLQKYERKIGYGVCVAHPSI